MDIVHIQPPFKIKYIAYIIPNATAATSAIPINIITSPVDVTTSVLNLDTLNVPFETIKPLTIPNHTFLSKIDTNKWHLPHLSSNPHSKNPSFNPQYL